MAGIGFELRKLMRHDSYTGLLQAYGFAGVISSGPWVLSIVGIMLVGVLSIGTVIPALRVTQFLVSVTYIMAASLIVTGFLQLMFTRFIADRLFEERDEAVLPNLLGALLLTLVVCSALGSLVLVTLFGGEDFTYRLLMLSAFVMQCGVWVVVVFLSGMKEYRRIVAAFFAGYSITVAMALILRGFGLHGLLSGFVIGQVVLLGLLLALVVHYYPGRQLLAFEFLGRDKIYLSLAATGFFYNFGIWADKFIFWMYPPTSEAVIGPLRASLIYDLPIFLAYLSIIPGMAVFLVRIETDFVEAYDNFYNAVREGDTLQHVRQFKDAMVLSVRQGLYDIFKVQGLTVVALFVAGPRLLHALGISPLYFYLFQIDVAAVGMQVVLLAILNVLFYLNMLRSAMALTALFALSNVVLTVLTLRLGPVFYGFGFAGAVLLTTLAGLWLLSFRMGRLEYETFMLRR
jgi:uncharacterized membrane protein